MKPIIEMTAEERCRHYEEHFGKIEKLLDDQRIPYDIWQQSRKLIYDAKGCPF